MKSFWVLLLTLFFLTACSNTESENVKTKAFYPIYKVTYTGSGEATVTATFQVGGSTGTYLELSSGDSVSVNGQSMSKTEILGIIEYRTTINAIEGDTYTFTLNRQGEGEYTSTVILPENFAFSANIPDPSSLGASLNVSWSGTGNNDSLRAKLNKSYTDNTNASVSENEYLNAGFSDGTVTFSTSETQIEKTASTSVSALITLTRYKDGSLDSVFEDGGSITASQVRESNSFTLQ